MEATLEQSPPKSDFETLKNLFSKIPIFSRRKRARSAREVTRDEARSKARKKSFEFSENSQKLEEVLARSQATENLSLFIQDRYKTLFSNSYEKNSLNPTWFVSSALFDSSKGEVLETLDFRAYQESVQELFMGKPDDQRRMFLRELITTWSAQHLEKFGSPIN